MGGALRHGQVVHRDKGFLLGETGRTETTLSHLNLLGRPARGFDPPASAKVGALRRRRTRDNWRSHHDHHLRLHGIAVQRSFSKSDDGDSSYPVCVVDIDCWRLHFLRTILGDK